MTTSGQPLNRSVGHQTTGLNLPMYIDGRPRHASDGATFRSENPYTRRTWVALPDATADDVDEAVHAARRALTDGPWRELAAHERGRLIWRLGDLIDRDAEILARLESLDSGKLLTETTRQAAFAARVYRYYAGFADKLDGRVVSTEDPALFDYLVHEPVGVCALLTAWNSPMQLLANKLPAALAVGNTVVIRPSEMSAASTAYLSLVLDEVGFPPGVVNIVTGADTTSARRLAQHNDVDLVSVTGGVETGRAVGQEAGRALKRTVMELGGKSPNIVFGDADLDEAVQGVSAGIFAAGGQTCIAGSRLLVERIVFDEMVDRLVARAKAMRLGDPLDPATDMGPLANRSHFERVATLIDQGLAEGARLVVGGVAEPNSDSLFVGPTILVDVDHAMSVAQKEIFGPVLVAMPFDGEADGIALANATKFGLAAGIWTRDLGRAFRLVRQVEAGLVWVNTYRRVAPAAPFGGVKDSGIGRERGREGLVEFARVKNVMIDTSPHPEPEVRTPSDTGRPSLRDEDNAQW